MVKKVQMAKIPTSPPTEKKSIPAKYFIPKLGGGLSLVPVQTFWKKLGMIESVPNV